MSHSSPRLGLPYIQPAQAQKHVTHNEALQILDQVTQLVLARFEAETPPPEPVDGQSYALGAAPTGEWAGQGGMLAFRSEGAWLFLTPQEGWRAWGLEEAETRIYRSGGWAGVDRLGIGTSADETNRLAVSGASTLLTHAGAGHQLKVNKAGPAETASLLFQSGWTGHAEMGLVGDDAFAVKVSADGSAWTQVMCADPASLRVDVPVTGTAVQDAPDDVTPGRLMRADYGYGPGNLLGPVSLAGGVPTGGVIERDSNANGEYLRLADGTQICWTNLQTDTAASTVWAFPASFIGTSSISVSGTGQAPAPRIVGIHSGTTNTIAVDVWDLTGSRTGSTARLVAIGRWF